MISKKVSLDLTVKVGHFCFIEDEVVVDFGTVIKNFIEINEGVTIGKNCIISSHVVIDSGVTIKDNTGIEEFSHVKTDIGPGIYGGSPVEKRPFQLDKDRLNNPTCVS